MEGQWSLKRPPRSSGTRIQNRCFFSPHRHWDSQPRRLGISRTVTRRHLRRLPSSEESPNIRIAYRCRGLVFSCVMRLRVGSSRGEAVFPSRKSLAKISSGRYTSQSGSTFFRSAIADPLSATRARTKPDPAGLLRLNQLLRDHSHAQSVTDSSLPTASTYCTSGSCWFWSLRARCTRRPPSWMVDMTTTSIRANIGGAGRNAPPMATRTTVDSCRAWLGCVNMVRAHVILSCPHPESVRSGPSRRAETWRLLSSPSNTAASASRSWKDRKFRIRVHPKREPRARIRTRSLLAKARRKVLAALGPKDREKRRVPPKILP